MAIRRGSTRALVAMLAAAALTAAACGGSDGDTTAAGEGTAASAGSGVTTGSDTGGGGAGDADALEAEWAATREKIVEKIKAGGYGIDEASNTLKGPGGFEIDLSECPQGWSNTEGLSDTEIKIGHTTAQSGTLADYGNIGRGMDVLWKYQNDNGGWVDSEGKNRKLTMITKDDGYDSTRTIPLVDELIDSDKVFAMWTLGSPNTLKTYDKLNERCIVQPYSMTGHPAWGDPEFHPWTTGMALSYTSEAILWGSFIETHADELLANDGKISVGALVMNNDFGKAYDVGFKNFLAQSPIKDDIEYLPETIEPAAPTIKDPMTTIASKNPEVFVAMTAGTSCTQAVTEAAENGLKDSAIYLFTGQPCKGASFMGKDKVGGDGSASDGWWIAGGGNIDGNAVSADDDAWFVWARDLLAKDGYNYKDSANFLGGFLYGWPFWQSVLTANELDGGLTRANLIVAIRSIDMTNPNLIPGIGFNLNGNADGYPIEGSEFAQYDYTQQTWIQDGDIVELSGKSANCHWDQSIGNCT